MLARPQLVAKIVHRFAPGVYLRTAIMEPGDYLGHEHLTEHFNIVTTGRALLIPLDARGGIAGPGREVGAGDIFAVTPGERKLVRVLETCTWTNVHPTTETDLEKIEAKFIRKSATWQHHAAALTQKDSPCLG